MENHPTNHGQAEEQVYKMIGARLSPDSLLVSQSASIHQQATSLQTVFQALPMHEENKATKKN